MSAKNTLNKIASLLNVDLAEETQVIALETMKLENGTTIEAEKFEKGEPVFIMTEDEEKVALPVGKYELENGMILVVAEEGVIGDMMKEEPKEEEEEVEASAEEVSEEVSEEVEMAEEEEEKMAYATKEELGKAMDELKQMIEEVKSMVDPKKKKEDMSAEESVSEEVVEEVQQELSVQEPAAKPIKANPEAQVTKDKSYKFSQGRKTSTLDRVLSKMAERKN
tara:strand:+ start:2627 stop:3295 length:669 start_codon:yes stop_codon:yes gene_type:complete